MQIDDSSKSVTRRASSADVARAAGVSKWTVIRAFKEDASISGSARKAVLEAAQQLGYRPNILARSLATNRTHQVAVLVDDFENPYKLPTLDRLTAKLQAEGLVVLLLNVNREYDYLEALLNADQRQVDAVVLFGTEFPDRILRDGPKRALGAPIYVLARDSALASVPAITCDSADAMRKIGRHLIERGYCRPGFLLGPRVMSTSLGRRRSFREFWQGEASGDVVEIAAASYDWRVGGQAMRNYLTATVAEDRVDVMVCENDILAIGALDAARSAFDVAVPDQMGFVGFDDIDLAGMPSFDLTTIRQPALAMVDHLVEMLVARQPSSTLRLSGELIVRGTT